MMAMLLIVVAVCVFLAHAQIAPKDYIPTYQCSFCLATMDHYLAAPVNERSIYNSCRTYFDEHICRSLGFQQDIAFPPMSEVTSRNVCGRLEKCSMTSTLPINPPVRSSVNNVDIRVSKALGSKGYGKVRISAISNATVSSSLFDYSEKFKYRWTDKYLSTGIVSVTPGQKTKFNIAGNEVEIYLPKEGAGVRGVILADPCFQSEWIVCMYQKAFDPLNRHTEILNAIFSHDDAHYWQILGDNFYDQQGAASTTWFNALSAQTKSRVFASVPGNHDFWVNASPKLWVPKDQQGNGFMQFYGQDVLASVSHAPAPFNFVNDPDGSSKGSENLPPADNFFFYNSLGNTAFIGYSGAHSLSSMEKSFEEACQWAQSVNPDVVLLLGHWNSDGDGCEADATVPAVYSKILSIPACAPLANKVRYFMGHKHCNIITEPNVGFMVGAQAMSDATSCGGAFGIPIVDTTDGKFRVYYFPFATSSKFDETYYNNVLSCIKESGVSNCYHLATEWANVKL